jgi:hypothetical protein
MPEQLPRQNIEPSHETINPHEVGIASTTFYPGWYPSEAGENPSADKVRGDIALATFSEAHGKGYQTVIVDGGSSSGFLDALGETGVAIEAERDRGMSASRRQAFEAVSSLEGVNVICWTEPEKVSIVKDCIPYALQPILSGEADIVVPRRDDESFATYPDYQVEFETTSNHLWNNILRRHGLLPEDAQDLDAWIGPRFFKNDPDIVKLFVDKYEFIYDVQSGLKKDAPELWPNALFLPIVAALKQGYRVVGVNVPYRHPAEQTAFEQDNDTFRQKRAYQQENILKTTVHFVRYLEENPASRIKMIPLHEQTEKGVEAQAALRYIERDALASIKQEAENQKLDPSVLEIEASASAKLFSEILLDVSNDGYIKELLPTITTLVPTLAQIETLRAKVGDDRFGLVQAKILKADLAESNENTEATNQRWLGTVFKYLKVIYGDEDEEAFKKDFSVVSHEMLADLKQRKPRVTEAIRNDEEVLSAFSGNESDLERLLKALSETVEAHLDYTWLFNYAGAHIRIIQELEESQ